MSLLSEAMEKCILLNKTVTADGYGGYVTTYTEGAEFDAACVLMGSVEVVAAQLKGTGASYTITTKRALNLQYHDVFKRSRDNKIFRVTSDGDDKLTPQSASLDMRQVTAQEWEIPNE